MSELQHGPKTATPSSFFRSVKMIAWSMLGIRKNSELEKDAAQVNPIHIIVAGVAGIFLFVLSLIALVNWVVAK